MIRRRCGHFKYVCKVRYQFTRNFVTLSEFSKKIRIERSKIIDFDLRAEGRYKILIEFLLSLT